MLNFETKNVAISRLERSVTAYNELRESVLREAASLHCLREATSRQTIAAVEAFVKSVSDYKVAFDCFAHVIHLLELESRAASVRGAVGVGAAVGLGAATMAAAPAAAMGIATTFGAASTGTAIAALSGAAQVSAATAWVGGGALEHRST